MKNKLYRQSSLIILALCTASGLMSAQAQDTESADGDWEISVGIAAQNEPITPGVDTYEVEVLPYLDVLYKDRYFVNGQNGLGVILYSHDDEEDAFFEDLEFGISIDFDEGRDPGDLDANSPLRGLNQIDATLEGKIFAEAELYGIEFGLSVAQDLADGHNGWYAEFSAGVDLPLSQRAFISAGPSIRYSSEDYQQSFYGVSALESLATGLAEYQPEAGFDSASFSIAGVYALSRNWSVLTQVEYSQLMGDAADSPFIEEEGQLITTFALAYSF